MNYSFSTVLMTILTSNLLIGVIVFCFRNRKVMLSVGYKLIALFLVLTLLRFVFPFEIPFARNIYFPKWLSLIVAFVRHPFISWRFIRISIWVLFGCVWIGGIYSVLKHHFRKKEAFRHFVIRYGVKLHEQEPYKSMLAEICGKRRNHLWVMHAPYYGPPLQYGILRPYIVIPDTMDFSEEEIYYILRHETAHYYHRDILLKEAVEFIRAVYWWNPACCHLVSKTDVVLEMRVDDQLVAGDEKEREAYCRVLERINEEIRGKMSMPGAETAISIPNFRSEDLEYRLSMLRREKKRKGPGFYLLAAAVIAVYILSYCFTMEAFTKFSWYDEGIEVSQEEYFYAVAREDGTYDIYFDGEFLENVDTLKLYTGISVREE